MADDEKNIEKPQNHEPTEKEVLPTSKPSLTHDAEKSKSGFTRDQVKQKRKEDNLRQTAEHGVSGVSDLLGFRMELTDEKNNRTLVKGFDKHKHTKKHDDKPIEAIRAVAAKHEIINNVTDPVENTSLHLSPDGKPDTLNLKLPNGELRGDFKDGQLNKIFIDGVEMTNGPERDVLGLLLVQRTEQLLQQAQKAAADTQKELTKGTEENAANEKTESSDKTKSQTPAGDAPKALTGQFLNSKGEVEATAHNGSIYDKDNEYIGKISADGKITVDGKFETAVNSQFKALTFNGTEEGHRRTFEVTAQMSNGKLFLPDEKDGHPVAHDVRMGMIINSETGEQRGMLRAPSETGKSRGLTGGSIIDFNRQPPHQEVPLRNYDGAVFDLEVLGGRDKVTLRGAAAGAEGLSADGSGLRSISEVADILRRDTTQARQDAKEKDDARWFSKDAEAHHRVDNAVKAEEAMDVHFDQMLKDGKVTPGVLDIMKDDSERAAALVRGDKIASFRGRLDQAQPILEQLPEQVEKINGIVILPPDAEGKSQTLEIRNGALFGKGDVPIGFLEDNKGNLTIINPETGDMTSTNIRDLKGSVWNMQVKAIDGQPQTVTWISAGRQAGVFSVADLKHRTQEEVQFANFVQRKRPDGVNAATAAQATPERAKQFNETLNQIATRGFAGMNSDEVRQKLAAIVEGPREHVRHDANKEHHGVKAPTFDVLPLTESNHDQVSGRLRLGTESYLIENGKVYSTNDGKTKSKDESIGSLDPGYVLNLNNRTPVDLTKENQVLLDIKAGDKQYHLIGLGRAHVDEGGHWRAGGLVNADQLRHEMGESERDLNVSVKNYLDKRPYITGGTTEWIIGREAQLDDFRNDIGRRRAQTDADMETLFSDGFDTRKFSNDSLDRMVQYTERSVADSGWVSRSGTQLAADGIRMQEMVRDSAAIAATTALTAGTGAVFSALAASGRITAVTATALEAGTTIVIGTGSSIAFRASDTSNTWDNAKAGFVEGATIASGGVIAKHLGDISKLNTLKELVKAKGIDAKTLNVAAALKSGQLTSEEAALFNTVVGKMFRQGFSDKAIGRTYALYKAADATIQSAGFAAASKIQRGESPALTAEEVALGAVVMRVADKTVLKAAKGVRSVTGTEGGVAESLVTEVGNNYGNAFMHGANQGLAEERERIAKEKGIKPEEVELGELLRETNSKKILQRAHEQGATALATSPALAPLRMAGEHAAGKLVGKRENAASHENASSTQHSEAQTKQPVAEAAEPATGKQPEQPPPGEKDDVGITRIMRKESATLLDVPDGRRPVGVDGLGNPADRNKTIVLARFQHADTKPVITTSFDGQLAPPGTVLTIGRGGDITVDPKNTLVGTRHAEVRVDADGNAFLKDSSKQGLTFVNDRQLKPGEEVPLKKGDRIKVGLDAPGENPNFKQHEVNWEQSFTTRHSFRNSDGQAFEPGPGTLIGGMPGTRLGVDETGAFVEVHPQAVLTSPIEISGYKLSPGQKRYLRESDFVTIGTPEKTDPKTGKKLGEYIFVIPDKVKPTRELDPTTESGKEARKQSNTYGSNHILSDKLEDGFRNAGQGRQFDSRGAQTNDLINYNGKTSPNPKGRIIDVVDRQSDTVLQDTIRQAKDKFGHLPPKERAEALAKHVNDLLKPEGWSENSLDTWYNQFSENKAGQEVLLGEYIKEGRGVCSQRALLMKVLGDELGLNVSLVRGTGDPNDKKSLNHAWTEVQLDKSSQPTVYDPRWDAVNVPYANIPAHIPGNEVWDAKRYRNDSPAALARDGKVNVLNPRQSLALTDASGNTTYGVATRSDNGHLYIRRTGEPIFINGSELKPGDPQLVLPTDKINFGSRQGPLLDLRDSKTPDTPNIHVDKLRPQRGYFLDENGNKFEAGKNSLSIGRVAGKNDLVFTDNTVSREHAVIHFDASGPVLENLSQNGTKVNGQQIGGKDSQGNTLPKTSELKPGDVIEIANKRLVFGRDVYAKPVKDNVTLVGIPAKETKQADDN